MPYAVTHILVPLFLAALFRDWYLNKKTRRKFSLHYVFIAGLAGALPDIDVAVFWVLHFFGFTIHEVHRTLTHSLLFPCIFLLLAALCIPIRSKLIGKHHLKLSIIFLMIGFGTLIHIVLDALFAGTISPFYPFSSVALGLNLVALLPEPLSGMALQCLDAALLILWLIYLEWKHKISDVI